MLTARPISIGHLFERLTNSSTGHRRSRIAQCSTFLHSHSDTPVILSMLDDYGVRAAMQAIQIQEVQWVATIRAIAAEGCNLTIATRPTINVKGNGWGQSACQTWFRTSTRHGRSLEDVDHCQTEERQLTTLLVLPPLFQRRWNKGPGLSGRCDGARGSHVWFRDGVPNHACPRSKECARSPIIPLIQQRVFGTCTGSGSVVANRG